MKPSSTTEAINQFLSSINISGWRVHPKIVEFNDPDDRERKATIYSNRLQTPKETPTSKSSKSSQKKKPLSPETIEFLVDDFKLGDVVSNGAKSMKQTGSIVMVAGDWERDLEQELDLESNYSHVVVVFLKNRQVSTIYILFKIEANGFIVLYL